jgi:kynurenine formamidase
VGKAKKNRIKFLKKDDGQVTKEKGEMEQMTRDFFQLLYTADENVHPEEIMHLVQLCITEEMNEELCKVFSEKEIGDALFQMGPLKVVGLDGFPARFFQRNWEIVKKDVLNGVKGFF